MKKTIIISSLLTVFACTKKRKSHFEGYVYYNNKPLDSVLVHEQLTSTFYTLSDSTGYFKLKKKYDDFTVELIFKKEGFITDTISLTRGISYPPLYTLFLRERKDTLFMKPTNNNEN